MYGLYFGGCNSIIPWQFTMVENFSKMEHSILEKIIFRDFFLKICDWTLEEYGPAIPQTIGGLDEDQDDSAKNLFCNKKATRDCLLGNNFAHYIEVGKQTSIVDILSASEVEIEHDDELKIIDEELFVFIPANSRLKRFVDSNKPTTYYNLFFVLDEEDVINEEGYIKEEVTTMGGGLFTIPVMDMTGERYYSECNCLPEEVLQFYEQFKTNKYIPDGFSLIGKKLPQKMINEGGNGGGNTEYTYAVQAPYRLAYTYMCVDATEEGIIEDFSFSTYQSSRNGYGDMFSRPVVLDNVEEEAMDTLLYIVDLYHNEE